MMAIFRLIIIYADQQLIKTPVFNVDINMSLKVSADLKGSSNPNLQITHRFHNTENPGLQYMLPDLSFSQGFKMFRVEENVKILSQSFNLPIECHSSKITSFAISFDCRYLVSTSDDRTLRIWSLRKLTQKCIITCKSAPITCIAVAVTKDYRCILFGSTDNALRLVEFPSKLDIEARKQVKLRGHEDKVQCIAVSSTNKYAISSTFNDFSIRIWNIETRKQEGLIRVTNKVLCIRISSDDKLILYSNSHRKIKILDWESRNEIFSIDMSPDPILFFDISSDKKYIALVSNGKGIILWNLNEKIMERILEYHTDAVQSLAISKNNSYLVSASYDRTLKVFNLSNNELVTSIENYSRWNNCIDITPDGKYVVAGVGDTYLRLWELKALCAQPQATLFKSHTGKVVALAATRNNKVIISASIDGTIRIWDTIHRDRSFVLNKKPLSLMTLAISNDDLFLFSNLGDKTIIVWDLQSYEELTKIKYPNSFSEDFKSSLDSIHIFCADITKSKEKAVICYENGDVQLWRQNSSKIIMNRMKKSTIGVDISEEKLEHAKVCKYCTHVNLSTYIFPCCDAIITNEKYAVWGNLDFTFTVVKI